MVNEAVSDNRNALIKVGVGRVCFPEQFLDYGELTERQAKGQIRWRRVSPLQGDGFSQSRSGFW